MCLWTNERGRSTVDHASYPFGGSNLGHQFWIQRLGIGDAGVEAATGGMTGLCGGEVVRESPDDALVAGCSPVIVGEGEGRAVSPFLVEAEHGGAESGLEMMVSGQWCLVKATSCFGRGESEFLAGAGVVVDGEPLGGFYRVEEGGGWMGSRIDVVE
jgi:hypothetical protein